jgi:hypothetical protein
MKKIMSGACKLTHHTDCYYPKCECSCHTGKPRLTHPPYEDEIEDLKKRITTVENLLLEKLRLDAGLSTKKQERIKKKRNKKDLEL